MIITGIHLQPAPPMRWAMLFIQKRQMVIGMFVLRLESLEQRSLSSGLHQEPCKVGAAIFTAEPVYKPGKHSCFSCLRQHGHWRACIMSGPYLTPELAIGHCDSDAPEPFASPSLGIPPTVMYRTGPNQVFVGRILGTVRVMAARHSGTLLWYRRRPGALLCWPQRFLMQPLDHLISTGKPTGASAGHAADDLGTEWAPGTLYQQGTVILPASLERLAV